jgi:hypothetical protein
MPDLRSAAQLNGIPMTGLLGSGAALNTYRAVCSGALNPTTTEADIPGCTASIVVPSTTSVVLVWACVDLAMNTTAGSTNIFINWNASDGPQYTVKNGRTTAFRATYGFVQVPPSSVGTFTCKLTASSSITGSSYTIRATHTTMTVLVVSD